MARKEKHYNIVFIRLTKQTDCSFHHLNVVTKQQHASNNTSSVEQVNHSSNTVV